MVATMMAAGNNKISMRNVYEMLTIPSKFSWLSPIRPVNASALYLTNVEYPPGSIPDIECAVDDAPQNDKNYAEKDNENEELVEFR